MSSVGKAQLLAVTWYFSFGYGMEPPYRPAEGSDQAGWEHVATRPAAGCYSSGDERTIRRQLEQMQKTGISVIMPSWWGWGDHDLDGHIEGDIGAAYNRSIQKAMRIVQEENLPFRFVILVEDFWGNFGDLATRGLTSDQRWMITNYLWENYYKPYEDLAFRYFGDRPLLISTIGEPGPLWGQFDDRRYDLREIYWTPESEGVWGVPAYSNPPSMIPGQEGEVMIWPRKSEQILHEATGQPLEPVEVDSLLRENAYDQAWKRILEHEKRDEIRLIWVWSWNSYNDLLYIEPDDGQGRYAHGETLTEKTRHYYDLYRTGRQYTPYSGS